MSDSPWGVAAAVASTLALAVGAGAIPSLLSSARGWRVRTELAMHYIRRCAESVAKVREAAEILQGGELYGTLPVPSDLPELPGSLGEFVELQRVAIAAERAVEARARLDATGWPSGGDRRPEGASLKLLVEEFQRSALATATWYLPWYFIRKSRVNSALAPLWKPREQGA